MTSGSLNDNLSLLLRQLKDLNQVLKEYDEQIDALATSPRLAQTSVDADRLLDLQTILQQQQNNLQTYLPRLKTLVEQARRAYQHGDIEALTFLNMESTWVNKRLEQISLLQASWENHIALQALLALPGYPVTAAR